MIKSGKGKVFNGGEWEADVYYSGSSVETATPEISIHVMKGNEFLMPETKYTLKMQDGAERHAYLIGPNNMAGPNYTLLLERA